MRMRRSKHHDSRMQACQNMLLSTDYISVQNRSYFDKFEEVCAEIGCGKGAFITKMAHANPRTLFIGIEKQDTVLLPAMERAQEQCLSNVRFICDSAEVIGSMFESEVLSKLFINFPDPWPALRHAKRRLTHARIAKNYMHILKPGGHILFKTDSEPLFTFSLESMQDCDFELLFHTFDLHAANNSEVLTEYEQKFISEGKKIMKAVFARP